MTHVPRDTAGSLVNAKPEGSTLPSGRSPASTRVLDPDERARALVEARRFQEAAEALLNDVEACGLPLERLDPLHHRRALRASICLANAGETARARELLLNLGEFERARTITSWEDTSGRSSLPRMDSAPGDSLREVHGATPAQRPGTSAIQETVLRTSPSSQPARSSPSAARQEKLPAPSEQSQPGDADVVNASDAPELTPGLVIDGRFLLERAIGEGGTARVFQTVDLTLNEKTAMKFLVSDSHDSTLLARFRAEVTLSRRLNHPNVIRLYDIGRYRAWHFITMELLSGTDLEHRLRSGPIALTQAIDLLIQTCDGLQAIHECGIVHRDLKPGNLFVTSDGTLKIMDFGLAKRRDAPGLTVGAPLAGTPLYMSPEQVSDFSTVTCLADLYSLGCIAYELFTGRPPFLHDEPLPLLVMHLNERPQNPRLLNPNLPRELEDTVLRLLEKAPAKRFQSCSDLASRLRKIR